MKRKKVLMLHVSKQWFNMIQSREKTEGYREIKEYWEKRLVKSIEPIRLYNSPWSKPLTDIVKRTFKDYTHVLFINGYGKNKPSIEKEIVSLTIGKPKKGLCPEEFLCKDYFVLRYK